MKYSEYYVSQGKTSLSNYSKIERILPSSDTQGLIEELAIGMLNENPSEAAVKATYAILLEKADPGKRLGQEIESEIMQVFGKYDSGVFDVVTSALFSNVSIDRYLSKLQKKFSNEQKTMSASLHEAMKSIDIPGKLEAKIKQYQLKIKGVFTEQNIKNYLNRDK